MAKKTINKELTGAQDLYNFLFEACNIIRGPVSQDNFKDYITPLLYYKITSGYLMFMMKKQKKL